MPDAVLPAVGVITDCENVPWLVTTPTISKSG